MSGGGILIPSSANHYQFELRKAHPTMSSRKRKAEEDPPDEPMTRTSSSPSPDPTSPTRLVAPRSRAIKRPKAGIVSGSPLPLPRLLETLSPDQLRGVLRTICEQHPQIGAQIVSSAPRPIVSSALAVLSNYQTTLRNSFPYGDRPTADYAYNRVRQSLLELLEALRDYTPHFLPPNETQPSTSLEYLDGVTSIIHHLPNWDAYQNNRHKQDAYEEIGQAWALVIKEAAKKGGGIQLQLSGWDQKLARHNQESGGRLQAAVAELRSSLGWMDGTATGRAPEDSNEDMMSIRQQLMSGAYGTNNPVQVGPW